MKRSLTLCTSMALLAPLTLALNLKDLDFSFNLGNRTVIIGDSSGTDQNLLGAELSTSTVTSAGTTTVITHSTPTAIFEVGASVPFADNHDLRLVLEMQIAKTDTHKVYDGLSKTALITFGTNGPVVDTDPVELTPGSNGTGDYTGSFGVISAVAGQRTLTVKHLNTLGGKVLYSLGRDNHNTSFGFSFLWTDDLYRYTVDLVPSVGTYSSTSDDTNFTLSSIAGPTGSPPTIDDATQYSTDAGSTISYSPDQGAEGEYDNCLLWVGLVAEGSSNITDSIAAKGGFGYYIREFGVSSDAATSAPMVAKATGASMYIGHVGLTLKTSVS